MLSGLIKGLEKRSIESPDVARDDPQRPVLPPSLLLFGVCRDVASLVDHPSQGFATGTSWSTRVLAGRPLKD